MKSNYICITFSISIYLLLMLFVGIYYSKKNKNAGDFYLGGRTLGPFVTAMSAEASDMSSWLLMGLPGLSYISGSAAALWTGLGLLLGTYINWLVVATKLRVYSETLKAITIPDFFNKRYNDKTNTIGLISALIIILFFIPYTAAGFAACGKLFNSLFGINYLLAMLISAAVIISYTALGGFLAASITDLIQSIVMTLALIVILYYGSKITGGFHEILNNANSITGYLSLKYTHNYITNTSEGYDILNIFSSLAWGLGYFGMPHILLRFMAIKDEKKLSLSRHVASSWVLISLLFAISIGIIGNAMSALHILPILNKGESETIIIKIAEALSNNGIFASLIAGIILAGILAATMSTSDSQLLAASSAVSQNILEEFMGIKLSNKSSMKISRMTVIIISLLAIFIASDPSSSIFEIVSFAWAGFAATFGSVIISSLFWKRSNKYGVLAGMITGALMVFIWKYLLRPIGGIFNTYELLPSFLIALITIIIVSHLTKAPDETIISNFESYKLRLKNHN